VDLDLKEIEVVLNVGNRSVKIVRAFESVKFWLILKGKEEVKQLTSNRKCLGSCGKSCIVAG